MRGIFLAIGAEMTRVVEHDSMRSKTSAREPDSNALSAVATTNHQVVVKTPVSQQPDHQPAGMRSGPSSR